MIRKSFFFYLYFNFNNFIVFRKLLSLYHLRKLLCNFSGCSPQTFESDGWYSCANPMVLICLVGFAVASAGFAWNCRRYWISILALFSSGFIRLQHLVSNYCAKYKKKNYRIFNSALSYYNTVTFLNGTNRKKAFTVLSNFYSVNLLDNP